MKVAMTHVMHRPATVTYLAPPNGNPGIVPPWLQGFIPGAVTDDPDTPRVMGAATPTVYNPQPITDDPDIPRIMRR